MSRSSAITPAETALALSRGATQLLRIALENDDGGALGNNAALQAVLEFIPEMVKRCRTGPEALGEIVTGGALPPTFLGIACAMLVAIQTRAEEMHRQDRTAHSLDFDRHAYQGLAHALADVAWPERQAKDFDGPPAAKVCARIAKAGERALQERVVQHYIANILLDLFAGARIRAENPRLSPDVEMRLREQDARAVASRVVVDLGANQVDPPVQVMARLRKVLRLLAA